MFSNLLNSFAILVSLSTASSVLLHDMRLDKAAAAALSMPVVSATYESNNKLVSFGGDLHTHIEQSSLSQTVRDLKTSDPSTQPRTDIKKYLMQKRIMRGHHAFDSYNLPIV